MSTTSETLAAAKSAVGNVPFHLRAAWTNAYALRDLLADRERNLTAAFSQHPNPNPLDLGNAAHHSYRTARDASADFIGLRVSLDLLEASADFLEADKIITPLVSEVRRLEAQLASETSAANQAAHDRAEALAAAKAAALAKIEAEFAQPEPEAAPEAPAPFRGKGLKMATA